ncbi:MAG: glycosyltransferase family 1 protein, partial [Flavobacteriaceae bacterium]|nr:glycosyltransferase family 1 protein [Flavobacteriaceae bacterium]
MRVLLLGEYSRLHNSLKEALQVLGHEVTLAGDGDLFKGYPVDIDISPRFFEANLFTRKFRVLIHKISGVDLGIWESYFRLKKHLKDFKDYDVVQFINSYALKIPLSKQRNLLQHLKKHNRLLWYCACGTDTPVVEANLKDKPGHHILTPLHLGLHSKAEYTYELQYIHPKYKAYFEVFEQYLDGITASDWDYAPVYRHHPKFFGLIPNPINIDKISYRFEAPTSVVNIFLGINTKSAHKKGHYLIRSAMKALHEKYPNRTHLIFAQNLAYETYIKKYQSAHVFMDMAYANDQGYNALEAMAAGKVVFTGAGKDFLSHYQ